jgi:hypothetical protein
MNILCVLTQFPWVRTNVNGQVLTFEHTSWYRIESFLKISYQPGTIGIGSFLNIPYQPATTGIVFFFKLSY